jgi:hypothetical protein
MSAMKLLLHSYFNKARWPLARVLQGLIGSGLLISGITGADSGVVLAGGLLALLALLNVGCASCSGNSCDLPK